MKLNSLACFYVMLFAMVLLAVPLSANVSVNVHLITNPSVPTTSQYIVLKEIYSIPSVDITIITHNYSGKRFPTLEVLPAYFFGPELEAASEFFGALTNNQLITANTQVFGTLTYQIPTYSYRPSFYLKAKREPNTLEIFYRPYCEYGLPALKGLLLAKALNKAPFKKLVITPIVFLSPNSNSDQELDMSFLMKGGLAECEETIIEMVIYENWPTKLLPYLQARTNIHSSYWTKAAKTAGLNPDKISKLAKAKGYGILEKAARRVASRGINSSPNYIWEGWKRYNFTHELLNEPNFGKLNLYSKEVLEPKGE